MSIDDLVVAIVVAVVPRQQERDACAFAVNLCQFDYNWSSKVQEVNVQQLKWTFILEV